MTLQLNSIIRYIVDVVFSESCTLLSIHSINFIQTLERLYPSPQVPRQSVKNVFTILWPFCCLNLSSVAVNHWTMLDIFEFMMKFQIPIPACYCILSGIFELLDTFSSRHQGHSKIILMHDLNGCYVECLSASVDALSARLVASQGLWHWHWS